MRAAHKAALPPPITRTSTMRLLEEKKILSVPILFAAGEKWAAVQKHGYLRDNQGKILLPAFMIRRKNVENNKDLATFNRYLQSEVMMSYSEKNKYDRFDLMNNGLFKSKPTKQIYAVSLPNHIIANYECIIWTDYVDQNNKILEQINYASKDYWGDRERFKFRARVDNYSVEQEVNDGEDRNVKTTFDINVNAYILNESYVAGLNGVKNTTQKLFTIRKIKLKEQVFTELLNSCEIDLPNALINVEINRMAQSTFANLKQRGADPKKFKLQKEIMRQANISFFSPHHTVLN